MLLLSLITLFAGPLLYQWLRRGGWIARTFDRVVVAILVLVVALLLVPETLARLGWPALLLMAAGYAVPGALERAVKRAASALHTASLVLALAGLMLHALLDGAGLAGSSASDEHNLAVAIVLHRFGMGLVIWMMVQPGYGKTMASAVLAGVAVATVAGYGLSERVLPMAGQDSLMIVQALIIGAILHSLVHRGHVHHGHG